jgi:hypothetical protein
MTSNEIRSMLKRQWPKLSEKYTLLKDRGFMFIPEAELQALANAHLIEWEASLPKDEITVDEIISGRKTPEDEDCDDRAQDLHCHVMRHYRKMYGIKSPAAIAWCIGDMFDGVKQNHTKNLAVTENGLVLLEQQTAVIKKPDKGDRVWFVNF